ncbi:MAG: LemA family protein [Coriobacteriia bacterium]|nr:LemA family protein [Coriobacteriia bacterium]
MEFLGWLIPLGLLAVLAVWAVSQYNMLVKLRNAVEEAFSTMDVYLKKRFDLVPNLVETVKGYAAHESGTFQAVTEARSMIQSATTTEEKVAGENMLTGALRSLFAVSENYPDLKANVNFMDLQRQLQSIETDIAQSRKFYNGVVKQMNNRVEMFPSNIFAQIFGFKRFPFFAVADEAEREAVAVSFA